MPTNKLELDTEKGDIEIREDELSTITDAELIEFGISRETLHDCFVEGLRLMQSINADGRVRPHATPRLDGEWHSLAPLRRGFSFRPWPPTGLGLFLLVCCPILGAEDRNFIGDLFGLFNCKNVPDCRHRTHN
jgi:hypothetical protein